MCQVCLHNIIITKISVRIIYRRIYFVAVKWIGVGAGRESVIAL